MDEFKTRHELKIRLLSPNMILPLKQDGRLWGETWWLLLAVHHLPTPSGLLLDVHQCSHPLVRVGRHTTAPQTINPLSAQQVLTSSVCAETVKEGNSVI